MSDGVNRTRRSRWQRHRRATRVDVYHERSVQIEDQKFASAATEWQMLAEAVGPPDLQQLWLKERYVASERSMLAVSDGPCCNHKPPQNCRTNREWQQQVRAVLLTLQASEICCLDWLKEM